MKSRTNGSIVKVRIDAVEVAGVVEEEVREGTFRVRLLRPFEGLAADVPVAAAAGEREDRAKAALILLYTKAMAYARERRDISADSFSGPEDRERARLVRKYEALLGRLERLRESGSVSDDDFRARRKKLKKWLITNLTRLHRRADKARAHVPSAPISQEDKALLAAYFDEETQT